MSTTPVPTDTKPEDPPVPGWWARTTHHPVTQKVGRVAWRAYIALVLLVITTQAVIFTLLWKWPSYDWRSLSERFFTGPPMAGLFAVIAAVVGAWSLNRQLQHTKQKAEDDAWWEQFEWVTDRIVSTSEEESDKGGKTKEQLPKSLAYNLMTALAKSARADFQKAAVAGIFEHYFKDTPSPEQDGSETSGGPSMDATEAESLRSLLSLLPHVSNSSKNAQRVLSAYDYEEDVQRALRHRFGSVHSQLSLANPGADALIESASRKLLIEVKLSVTGLVALDKTGNRLRSAMDRLGASGAVIITRPPSLKSAGSPQVRDRIKALGTQGIHLIEWDPAEGSGALQDRITTLFPDMDS